MVEVSYIGINAFLFLYIVTVARDTNNIDSRPPGAVGWIRTNGSFRYTPLAGERTRPTMRLRHIISGGCGGDRTHESRIKSPLPYRLVTHPNYHVLYAILYGSLHKGEYIFEFRLYNVPTQEDYRCLINYLDLWFW